MEEKAKSLDLMQVFEEEQDKVKPDHPAEDKKLVLAHDDVDGTADGEGDFGANPVDELNKALESKSKAKIGSPEVTFGRPYDHLGHQP